MSSLILSATRGAGLSRSVWTTGCAFELPVILASPSLSPLRKDGFTTADCTGRGPATGLPIRPRRRSGHDSLRR